MQDTVVQHLPTEGGKTEEASLVWGRWRVGWGTGHAFRLHPLLSWGHSTQAKECSQFTCPAAHPTKSSQHSQALTWGAQPKVLAAASPSQSCSQSQARPERERQDPVRYPCWWIVEEMSQPSNPHPHWWREIKASGRTNLGACIVHIGHNDPATHIMPYGRWQSLGCQWCSKKPQGGGMPFPCYMGFVHRTFSPCLWPPRISGSSDRRRHWLWPVFAGLLHPEPKKASYEELSGSCSSAWPHWWPSMQMMLWKPPCGGLLRRNQDPPPLWKRRPPSWAKEIGPWECQALPPDKQKSLGSQNLLSRLLLLLPLLHPAVIVPGRERSHGKGLMSIPITLVSGSEPIWRGITGSHSGGRNFALLSALQMGTVMMPRSKYSLPASCSISPASHPKGSAWHLDCTTLPGSAGKKRVPWPNRPQDNLGLSGGVEGGEVALAFVLQRWAIHAGASPDVFCGAVQELQDCLVPMVEEICRRRYGRWLGRTP